MFIKILFANNIFLLFGLRFYKFNVLIPSQLYNWETCDAVNAEL